jgi:hypothetical protein
VINTGHLLLALSHWMRFSSTAAGLRLAAKDMPNVQMLPPPREQPSVFMPT